MKMKLFYGEPNAASLSVLAAIFEKNIEQNSDLQLQYIDLARGERHQRPELNSVEVAYSVEGEGPVLVVDDEPMADSVFIACFLDEQNSGTKLVPADAHARWQLMTWCRYVIERVAPAAAFLGTKMHFHGDLAALTDAEFAAATDNITCQDLKQRWQDVRAGEFSAEQEMDSRGKITEVVVKLESALAEPGDWIMGEFSLADLETFGWLNGMLDIVPTAFNDAPNTKAWLQRVAARDSVSKALALAQSSNPAQAWVPGPEINRWG